MNIKFKSETAIIYDFLRVIVIKYNGIKLLETILKKDLTYSSRAKESYEYIWQNIDINVPGLPIFFSNDNSHNICYMYHMFDFRLHEISSIDQLIENAFNADIEHLQVSLLKFFSDSDKPDSFYNDLIKTPIDMVSYIESLNLQNKLKWDLINFIYSSDLVLSSLRDFCSKVKSRINHVYKKHATEIRDFNRYMSSKLKVNPSAFLDNEMGILFSNLPSENVNNHIVTFSLINELLVSCYIIDSTLIYVLGIRYEEQVIKSEKSGRFRNYETLFKALGDKNRLLIMELLIEKEMCVTDIASTLNLAFTTTSYHLEVMYSAGILIRNSVGKKIYYDTNREFLADRLYLIRGLLKKGVLLKL